MRLLTTLLAFLFISAVEYASADSKPVRIAANLPLSGDLAQYGIAIQRGSLLAESDLRQKSEQPPAFAFDWQDNKGHNRDAYTIMSSQLAVRPDLYISGLKPQTMTITEQVSKAGIPHFTWILDVKINPASSNNFRAWVSFKLEADAYLAALKKRQPKRVAMLYAQLPAAELQFKELLAPALKQKGAQDVWIEGYPVDTHDYKTLALKVKAYNPDLIILNGFAPHLISFIRDLRRLQLIREGNTFASLDMLEAAESLSKEQTEGIVVAAPDYITNSGTEARQAWTQRYKEMFGAAPSYHAAFAYDSMLAIAEAAKTLPPDPSPGDWLKSLRAVRLEGITGEIAFDNDGSSLTTMRPAMYKNGALTLLDDASATLETDR